jgi:hypothetical protein
MTDCHITVFQERHQLLRVLLPIGRLLMLFLGRRLQVTHPGKGRYVPNHE